MPLSPEIDSSNAALTSPTSPYYTLVYYAPLRLRYAAGKHRYTVTALHHGQGTCIHHDAPELGYLGLAMRGLAQMSKRQSPIVESRPRDLSRHECVPSRHCKARRSATTKPAPAVRAFKLPVFAHRSMFGGCARHGISQGQVQASQTTGIVASSSAEVGTGGCTHAGTGHTCLFIGMTCSMTTSQHMHLLGHKKREIV